MESSASAQSVLNRGWKLDANSVVNPWLTTATQRSSIGTPLRGEKA